MKVGQVVEITIAARAIVGEMKNLAATSDRDKVLPFDTVERPMGIRSCSTSWMPLA